MRSENIIEKFEEALRNLSDVEIDVEEVKSRSMKPEKLDALFANGPVVCSIFDHATFKFKYMSRNVEQMLGIPSEQIVELEYQEFLQRHFHPADLEIVLHQLFDDTVTFIADNAKTSALRISIQYNYRMQTASGKWIKVKQQTTPIKLGEKGEILLDQSFYSPAGTADYNETHPIELSIYVRDNKGLYNRTFSKTYSALNGSGGGNGNGITQRELEVLKLLAKGKTSRQIGQLLYISESTVVTHRKNMLEKFGLNNTSELIAFAFKTGVL